MLRKLLILALYAVVAFALSAVPASGQGVEIHNPGEFEVESEVDIAVAADHPTLGHIPRLQCDHHWFTQMNATGAVHFSQADVGISTHSNPPSVGLCDTVEACAEWDGQIQEEPSGAFVLHLTFCLSGTDNPHLENIPKTIECPIEPSGDVIHCDHRIMEGGIETGGLPVEIEGELFLDHPLDLEHF